MYRVTDIALREIYNLRMRPQAGVQLVAAAVEGVDAARPAREQDLREAAGRGADVEADAALRIEPEMIKRGGKLDPAAGDVGVRRRAGEHGIGGGLHRRLGNDHPIDAHAPRGNGRLRLGAALEQAPLDEEAIDAHAPPCG